MAVKIKNTVTGEIVLINGVQNKVAEDGSLYAVGMKGNVGEKFMQKHGEFVFLPTDDDTQRIGLKEGYEFVRGRAPKATTTDTEAANDEPANDVAPTATNADEPTATTEPATNNDKETTTTTKKRRTKKDEPDTKATDTTTDTDTILSNEDVALIMALKRVKSDALTEEKVEAIVEKVLMKFDDDKKAKAAKAIKKAKKATKKEGEVYCEGFKKMVRNVRKGYHIYLFGPAGSGKSHTAEQIANELGLDFYGQTTIQFAHDVRGYGDAGGNFQDTPFFKAFAFGGLYFQDEYDRSNAEAAIVLNSAFANGWYDFPIIGRVEAHPNFRFMAAGNTLMNGQSDEYCTGQQIDASSRDRFKTFHEVGYSHEVEMKIANGDAETVAFVEDVRNAIKSTNIQHVVSYRATEYMCDSDVRSEDTLEEILKDCTFKGLDVDAMNEIFGALKNKSNVWAKALRNIIA